MNIRAIVVLCLASWLGACLQAQPTTAPATQPVAADQSTPRGAVKMLITAMSSGDAAAVRSVVVAGNPLEQRLMDAWIAQQVAIVKFQKAANTALGQRAARRLLGDVAADQAQAIRDLDAVPEHITGETATVGEDDQQEQLVRKNGKWMLTMASSIPIACGASGVDAQEIEESISGMNIRARAMDQTADELARGQYQTVAQVQRALEAKQSPPPRQRGQGARQITKPTTLPAPSDELARALRDVDTFTATLPAKTPEQLIASFILLGSQKSHSYEYYHDDMANRAIRKELASRGASARDALGRHTGDTARIFEGINGPGDTVGRVCQELLRSINRPSTQSAS